jgi:hypothetical protein
LGIFRFGSFLSTKGTKAHEDFLWLGMVYHSFFEQGDGSLRFKEEKI